MMKTKSKLLREAYPVLLLISLLMTWELTSQGSPSGPQANFISSIPWSLDLFKSDPVCKVDMPKPREPQRACVGSPGTMSEKPLLERISRFPWEKARNDSSPKSSAEWESL